MTTNLSRYEPHYAPGGTFYSPRCGVMVVHNNDGSTATIGTCQPLSVRDEQSLTEHLVANGYKHVMA